MFLKDRLPVPERVKAAAELAMHDGLDAVLDTVTPMLAAQMLRTMAYAFLDEDSGFDEQLGEILEKLIESGIPLTLERYNKLLAATYLLMANDVDPDEPEAVDRGKKV